MEVTPNIRGMSHRDYAFLTYLAEYENIWEELFSRFDNQRQAFNYLVTILAASIGVAASATVQLSPKFFFFLPIIVAPLSFIFFDNELMIWAIVRYTHNDLQNKLESICGDEDVLNLEWSRFKNLGPRTARTHRLLSLGRWGLFIFPMIGSIVYASVNTDLWWRSGYLAVFLIDCALSAFLLWSMFQAAREQRVWSIKRPGKGLALGDSPFSEE